MALLNDQYLFVVEEDIDSTVQTSEHPVETGVSLTDHVLAKPSILRLTGEIVGEDADEVVNRLRDWQVAGTALSYVGRHVFSSAQIIEFSYGFTHRIAGGCSFSMTLREVRVARNVYAVGLGYTGNMEVRFRNGAGIDRIVNLSEKRERYHALAPGETIGYLAQQYRSRGVTADGIRALNKERDVFRLGHVGDFDQLLPGARLLMGVW